MQQIDLNKTSKAFKHRDELLYCDSKFEPTSEDVERVVRESIEKLGYRIKTNKTMNFKPWFAVFVALLLFCLFSFAMIIISERTILWYIINHISYYPIIIWTHR